MPSCMSQANRSTPVVILLTGQSKAHLNGANGAPVGGYPSVPTGATYYMGKGDMTGGPVALTDFDPVPVDATYAGHSIEIGLLERLDDLGKLGGAGVTLVKRAFPGASIALMQSTVIPQCVADLAGLGLAADVAVFMQGLANSKTPAGAADYVEELVGAKAKLTVTDGGGQGLVVVRSHSTDAVTYPDLATVDAHQVAFGARHPGGICVLPSSAYPLHDQIHLTPVGAYDLGVAVADAIVAGGIL